MNMKMLFAVLILVSTQVQARSQARFRVIAQCKSVSYGIDHGTTVTLQTDLLTRAYLIRISENTIRGAQIVSEEAQKLDVPQLPIGVPAQYVSKNYRLSINFTTTPPIRPGALTINTLPARHTIALVCQDALAL